MFVQTNRPPRQLFQPWLRQRLGTPTAAGSPPLHSVNVQDALLYMRRHTDRRIELFELAGIAHLRWRSKRLEEVPDIS
jgi:hypothetical protein